ncbi:MAG: hypothetical protein ACYC7D_10065 [Nitrososphaerales archaeon]
MPSGKEKELEELKKNVEAQEERLGEALRIFNQLSQEQSRDSNGNVVLWETLNTSVTILGDLLSSYRNYTEKLEQAVEKSSRKIESLKASENEDPTKAVKKTKKVR